MIDHGRNSMGVHAGASDSMRVRHTGFLRRSVAVYAVVAGIGERYANVFSHEFRIWSRFAVRRSSHRKRSQPQEASELP